MPRSKKTLGCVISLVLTSLLLVSGLVVFLALTQPSPRSDSTALTLPSSETRLSAWLVGMTGEEVLLAQVKGLSDLAAGVMRPRLHTADLAPVANAGVNPFGVNVFLEQEVDPAKREQVVRLAKEAGFQWLRQEFPWEDIEIHGKGDFEDRRHQPAKSAWEKYDNIVDLAEAYDLELIVRLSNPPTWARADGDARGTFAPPDSFEDFGDYVAAVVERYKGRVRYYQIWNEPNIYPEWGEMPVSPERYTELLKIAATRAREIDPNVVIISGALASTIDLDGISVPGRNFNDLTYLQRMYDAGAAPYFDVLAMQGYGLWSGPTDRRMNPRVINFSRPRFVRDVMVRNGDEAKSIWISEMNWNAVPDDIPDKRYGQVTLEQQAAYLPMAYERLQREWPWLGVANTWYLKRATDEWEQQGQPQAYFRLLTPDFQPLPVYSSFKAYAADLRRTLHKGYHQEDDWAIDYRGDWQTIEDDEAVLGGLRSTEDPSAELSFDFEGSDLILVAPEGPGMGQWLVEVDGRERARVTLESNTSQAAQLTTVLSGFTSAKSHRVVMRPALNGSGETVGPVAIDGLIVRRRNMALVNGLYCLTTLVFLLFLSVVGFFWVRSRQVVKEKTVQDSAA